MQLTLRQKISQFSHLFQDQLFPMLEKEVGEMGESAKRLTAVLSMIPLVRFVPMTRGWNGRPAKDRLAIASAFVAKAVLKLGTTRQVIDRLKNDEQLRRLCGWNQAKDVPHEATFSRAFAEFAAMELPQFVHEALVRDTQKERLIGHIARDSTAIEARERFPQAKKKSVKGKKKNKAKSRKKTGPKKKGGISRKELTRLERQNGGMTVDAMLAEIPKSCSIGTKVSSKGHRQYWRGYKLHLDVADGQIPISAVLTGASVHDSQVAIPLATITAGRVTSLYDLMDAAYDAKAIKEHSRKLGHVPIVDPAQRVGATKNVIFQPKKPRQFSWAEKERYRERTIVERVNARIKDDFGGRTIRVRGPVKVMAHLMFGVLALTVEQLLRLTP
jgi:hypothetical protein